MHGRQRVGWTSASVGGAALLLCVAAAPRTLRSASELEVVATGVPRPLELVIDGRSLIVLSPGAPGDAAAGEIYRVALDAARPVDLSHEPRVRIPFADARLATLGSLAVDPQTHELFLGEENGNRLYRLSADERLSLYATGLHRLAGGGTLTFDGMGRLLVVDYVDPFTAPGEEHGPPALETLREEDYRGPVLLRLALEADIPLPRRLDRAAPLYPRAWGGGRRGALLPRFISLAAGPANDVTLLGSSGEVLRVAPDGRLRSLARLPPGYGQYNRTHMVQTPDGGVLVSGGFQTSRIFRVSAEGSVTIVARNLADPEGIALDTDGQLYVAESSLHRIIRLQPAGA